VSAVLLGFGLMLLVLPGALAPMGTRLSPPEWCRAVSLCLRVGRFAVLGALGLTAAPALLDLVGAEHVAHACHRMVAGGLPFPAIAGWVAAWLLVAATARSLAAWRRDRHALRRLHAEPWLGDHRVASGVDVVTLPCPHQLAYAVPGPSGRPDQIVVSDGLVATLDDDELHAVLRHEQAHLRHRHHRLLRLAGDLDARAGWLPPVRDSLDVLRLAVERWADEDAAGGSHDDARPTLRRALLKTTALALGPVPSFTDTSTVGARLHALAAPPPAPTVPVRVAATGPMLSLCLLVAVTVTACVLTAHHGLDGLLGHCPF
jgi:hypothetical protein